MISLIKGIIIDKALNLVTIENNGMGFDIVMSTTSLQKLSAVGEQATIYTYLFVREDEMTLYGFADKFEKEVFLKLLLVNGVGPKMAVNILSCVSAEDLSFAIATQNVAMLKNIKGVGAKIRERILLELKEKMDALSHLADVSIKNQEISTSETFSTALNVLMDWGVQRAQAQSILTQVYEPSDQLEELISKAFRAMGR